MNKQAISIEEAQAFLSQHLGKKPENLELLGEGAWSRCFGFQNDGQELAIRFGQHVEDFEKDKLAAGYATQGLPIPQVLAIGPAFDGYYAISTRVFGAPLEDVSSEAWHALLPVLVAMFEALRTADISARAGWGGWGADGHAALSGWHEHVLGTEVDNPHHRTHGWRERLRSSAIGEESFVWGLEMLKQLARDDIPRSLVHCDLINRNVFVDGHRISGVFDWGCSIYGDHLYELAWFEFWAPWHPNLDIPALRAALEQHWQQIGYHPSHKAERLTAAYLHIGLDHVAYNAYLGDWENVRATAERMRDVVEF